MKGGIISGNTSIVTGGGNPALTAGGNGSALSGTFDAVDGVFTPAENGNLTNSSNTIHMVNGELVPWPPSQQP